VIAIIAILASMLMPALSGARAKAQTISCVSKMKQLGMASSMYQDDNKNYLPILMNKNFMEAVLGAGANPPTSDYHIIYRLGSYLTSGEIRTSNLLIMQRNFLCPAGRHPCPDWWNHHYDFNYYLMWGGALFSISSSW